MKKIFFFSIKYELQQQKKKKAKDKYCKQKAADDYLRNKEDLKEKSKNRFKNLPEEVQKKLKNIKERNISSL